MKKNLLRYSIFALLMLALSASAFAGVVIQVGIAPPALPVYTQPPCPGDGYIWTPGYWAYGPDGYYWVPGTWVAAPEPGLLWTPGYWGWGGGFYVWHAGYWGPHVGFYGGINYGFGYVGVGYVGGYWHGRDFFYNRTINNVTVTNVHIYNKTVINNVTVNRVSFNGGQGGIMARPRPEELRADNDRHFEPTRMQFQHENGARGNREFLASVNHGRPAIAATARPGEFRGRDVAPARDMGRNERSMDNRGTNRGVPRPENARNMDRPMRRQDGRNDARNVDRGRPDNFNRGGDQRNTPRPDNRMENRGGAPRPTAYHADNARGHENAPPRQEKQEREDRGRK
jgi:YXWGXW repeat-containing protein